MKVLAIETTGKYGSASVIDDDGRVFSASSSEEMNHLRGMITLIDEAVREAGITKDELTHVAASVGPGSFTGIRIGVTTARIMSQMLEVPCIAVSTLEAMAVRKKTSDIRGCIRSGVYDGLRTSVGHPRDGGEAVHDRRAP